MDKETEVIIVGASTATRKAIIAALINQITVSEARDIDFDQPMPIRANLHFEDHLIINRAMPSDLGPIIERKGGKKSRRIW